MIFQPGVQSLHNWPTSFLSYASSMLGRMAPDLRLDRIQCADACQHPGSKRRFVTPGTRPAPRPKLAQCLCVPPEIAQPLDPIDHVLRLVRLLEMRPFLAEVSRLAHRFF